MNRTALIAKAFAAFLCAGTVLAQTPAASTPSTPNIPTVPSMVGREPHTLSPEDVLSIRDLSELQLSPDGKRIAFVVREPFDPKQPRESRTSNIWIVPTDGSEPPRPLVFHLKNATSPSWSPDGQTLAFLSDRGESNNAADQTTQVYLLRSNGGKGVLVERLTSVPGGVEQFAWSPDGKMIAFIARDQATAEEQERKAAGYDAIEADRNFKYTRLWVTNLSDPKALQVTKQILKLMNSHGLPRATNWHSSSRGLPSLKTHFSSPWSS